MVEPDDGIEYLEHAGDARIRVRAGDLPGLFARAARGLTGLMTDPQRLSASLQQRVDLQADGPGPLLVDWLNELIFLFETRGFLMASCEIGIDDGWRLQAGLAGEAYDPDRHPIETVVKAATHHELTIREEPGGWLAEVVIDL